jgi:MFS family permease
MEGRTVTRGSLRGTSATPDGAVARVAGRLPPGVSFWLLAGVLGVLMFAASAPSPLYVVYQAEWGFSALVLTCVFGVYALVLLATLLVAGSVSDHVGRRPALLAALAVQLASMLLFATAGGVGSVFAARALQGAATGLATGTISAALLDLQPARNQRLGALVGSATPSFGLAAGALGAGLLVEYGPAPTRLVFWLLAALVIVAAGLVVAMPEPVVHDPRWRRALRPRIGVPRETRGVFAATVPAVIACWSLGGLYMSLGPSIAIAQLHTRNHVVGGLVVFALAGAGGVATVAGRNLEPRAGMLGGASLLVAGTAVGLAALHAGSTVLFFAGSVVAGIGFGPAFTGAFRILAAAAPPGRRAALLSASYLVSYLAFSVPAIAAGLATSRIGLRRTTDAYGVAVIALAAAAIVAMVLRERRPQPSAGRPAIQAESPGRPSNGSPSKPA